MSLKIVSKTLLKELVKIVIEKYIKNVREHVDILDEVVEQVAKQVELAGVDLWIVEQIEEKDADQFRQTANYVDYDT